MRIMDAELKRQLDDYYEILSEYYNSEGENEVDDDGNVEVRISMTDECDDVVLPVDQFLDYMSDLKSLSKVDETTVRTRHIRQTIIDTPKHGSEYIAKQLSRYVYVGANYQVRVVDKPFLIGLQNAKDFNCDDNYMIWPCTGYLAIEIKYSDNNKLPKSEEDNMIKRILYDLTRKVGVGVYVSVFWDVYELAEETDLEYSMSTTNAEYTTIDIRTIPQSVEMLDLYRQAKEILNPDIAFLHYYKIMEYVSPAVAKKKAIAQINNQLNQPSSVARDYHYMNAMLEIASQYRDDQKDDYLMNNLIQECLDVKLELHHLPELLLRQIKNNLGVSENADLGSTALSTDKEISLKKQVASILYSTRNSIVHAKANYNPTGWECPKENLQEINELMDSFALRMIEWNEAQAEYVKV